MPARDLWGAAEAPRPDYVPHLPPGKPTTVWGRDAHPQEEGAEKVGKPCPPCEHPVAKRAAVRRLQNHPGEVAQRPPEKKKKDFKPQLG